MNGKMFLRREELVPGLSSLPSLRQQQFKWRMDAYLGYNLVSCDGIPEHKVTWVELEGQITRKKSDKERFFWRVLWFLRFFFKIFLVIFLRFLGFLRLFWDFWDVLGIFLRLFLRFLKYHWKKWQRFFASYFPLELFDLLINVTLYFVHGFVTYVPAFVASMLL